VTFFLSPRAQRGRDVIAWGTFPRAVDQIGLKVFVPTASYLLALKLKALRVAKFEKGTKDHVASLLAVLGIKDVEAAIRVLT
jgi:hypothetical protein